MAVGVASESLCLPALRVADDAMAKSPGIRAEREIKWLGNLLIPGLLDGEHLFLVDPLSKSKTRFLQREEFNGVLLPFLWKWFGDQGRRAFEMMNGALKAEAERLWERSQ